jgi:hypothetical protein
LVRLSEWIVKQRHKLLILFIILAIVAGYAQQFVVTNYELSHYLGKDMASVDALDAMKGEFGLPTSVRVMVGNVTLFQAKAMKDKIARIDGVDQIIWLDDYADIYQPIEQISSDAIESYYREGHALLVP